MVEGFFQQGLEAERRSPHFPNGPPSLPGGKDHLVAQGQGEAG